MTSDRAAGDYGRGRKLLGMSCCSRNVEPSDDGAGLRKISLKAMGVRWRPDDALAHEAEQAEMGTGGNQ